MMAYLEGVQALVKELENYLWAVMVY
jgi:hypothetical protein